MESPRSSDAGGSENYSDCDGFGDVQAVNSINSSISQPGRKSCNSLPTELDPELLQGVSLAICLQGWGKHWARTTRVSKRMSKPIQKFDSFLSHDWQTPGWLKFLTLLTIFNSRMAAIASLVVSLAVGLLRVSGALPDSMWTVSFGYVAFYVFLFFGQSIRSWLRKPVIVFLDKLCIDQTNDALKSQGIMGLAGFLDRADSLTVLWSPEYFRRLWCTYEMATFLRNVGQKRLELLPVRMGFLIFLMSTCWRLITFAYYLLSSERGPVDKDSIFLVRCCFLALLTIMVLPMHFYKGLALMKSIRELPEQLRSFRVQDAECFCCSHGHRHPETGEELICDRKLVFDTLEVWYGSPDEEEEGSEGHLELFNDLVRDLGSSKQLQAATGDTLPFHYAMYMVVSANLPWITEYMSILAAGPGVQLTSTEQAWWSLRTIMDWAQMCFVILAAMRGAVALWVRGVPLLERLPRGLVAALLIPCLVLWILILWLPFQLTLEWTNEGSPAPLLPFLLVAFLVVFLYRHQATATKYAPREDLSEKVGRISSQRTNQSNESLENSQITLPTTATLPSEGSEPKLFSI